tara:strand:+ start:6027 stop:6446 length:420 start_codon:yes stop_codon:yes gene_type:complete
VFKDWLLGKWTNLKQAQSNPTRWAHVYLTYKEERDGIIHCKQWYEYEGEDKPYRERYHRLQHIADDVVLVESEIPDCDMICTFDGTAWNGEVDVQCKMRDANVESYFKMTEDTIECYDIGLKDGIRVFGGRDPYLFKRA